MKVIVEGVLPDKKIQTGICTYCRCQVECEEDEVSREDVGLGLPMMKFVLCPTRGCSMNIYVYPKMED